MAYKGTHNPKPIPKLPSPNFTIIDRVDVSIFHKVAYAIFLLVIVGVATYGKWMMYMEGLPK